MTAPAPIRLLGPGIARAAGLAVAAALVLAPRPAPGAPAAAPPSPRAAAPGAAPAPSPAPDAAPAPSPAPGAAPAPSPAPGAQPRAPGQVVQIEHRDPDAAPARGPAHAPVTIELFFLPAPNSQLRLPAYRALERLAANHPRRLRVIYRVINRSSPQMATLALEAQAQGKFFELMEQLQATVPSSTLSTAQIIELAKKLGMDRERLLTATRDNWYGEVFAANEHRLERILRTQSSTPAVLFNTRPPRTTLATMTDADYEREYNDAYERAMDLIDRGIEPGRLMDAFDALVLRGTQPFVSAGPTDNDGDGDPDEHRLASPPLDLRGLPTYGRAEARGTLPVVLLCRPNAPECGNTIQMLQKVQKTYADEVHLVWAPWFEVSREDAAELTLLGDAVLCAEELGSSADDLKASSGWQWIVKQLYRASRSRSRRSPAEKLIDDVAADLDVEPRPLAACRALRAGATIDWIEQARRAGVTRAPALIIGGRIYEGIPDQGVIQQLIEAELAPGVLGELAPAWTGAH